MLDGVGCGELADASAYGDRGSDTLGNIARHVPLAIPRLRALGLDRVAAIGDPPPSPGRGSDRAAFPAALGTRPARTDGARGTRPARRDGALTGDGGPVPRPAIATGRRPGEPTGAYGRMAEASPGKDSVTGHWEIAGIVLDQPFPTFPSGFPGSVIAELERRIGRGTIGNVVASGTEIIDRLGPEHMRSGSPIVYTSADSVFQIAAHENVIPIAEQYRICEAAFDLVARGLGVARVIARPFTGAPGTFVRTGNRHDYALEPTGETLLDALAGRGIPVVSIGKVNDLFAGRGIARSVPTTNDGHGMESVIAQMRDGGRGLIFANLVDFDTVFGHRNDVRGYAANLEAFDARLESVEDGLRDTDLLVVTADHGNDPTTPSTDHSREYVPLLLTGSRVRAGADVGTRPTFADLGQTIAEVFEVGPLAHGESFLGDILVEHP